MHILVVEDHPDTRSMLERMLSSWGHEVVTADGVRAGLTELKNRQFDTVVSDIALGDGSGYELMQEARRFGVDAQGIAISAYRFPEAVWEPKVTGFDSYVLKPFTMDELRSAVEKRGVSGRN